MPYELKGNCVHKVGDEKPLKCYDNHADAVKYLGALEANVEEAKTKQFERPSQQESNYIPLSVTRGKACANCRWLIEDDACFLIDNQPETILPTGYCDRWEAKPEPAPDPVATLTEAVTEAIEGLADTMDTGMSTMAASMPSPMMQMEMEHKPKGIIQTVKEKLFPPKPINPFTVFKGTDGEWYWLARYTNNFEDRDQEIISEKAIDDYVMRVDMGLIDLPELWVWHVPGTRHGKAIQVFREGHFGYALGTFDKTPEAEHAKQYYQKNTVELSHGFTAPTWSFEDGVYKVANTFEITTLPVLGTASNPYTEYEVLDMGNMADDPKKRPALEKVLGKEKVEQLIAHAKEGGEVIETLARYKDYADVNPDAPVAKDETDPTFVKAYVETVEAQGEILKIASGMDKTLKALQTRLDAYEKEVKELRTLVNAGPRQPSADPETKISKEELEKIQKTQPNSDDKRDQMRSFMFGASTNGGN